MAKLHLALKAEYFDAIRDGTKVEEYRIANAYWTRRLHHGSEAWSLLRLFDGIVLTRGYPKTGDPERTLERPWNGFARKTITHPHFGPDPVEVFAIDVSPPWVKHDGKGMPVDPKAKMHVRTRAGDGYGFFRAEEYSDDAGSWWNHNQSRRDIVEYRPSPITTNGGDHG